MKFANLFILSASMFACGGGSDETDEKETETEEETFTVSESDIIGHWRPHEYPVEYTYDDGDFYDYDGIHLIIEDDFTGTFEFTSEYTRGDETEPAGRYSYMAQVTVELDELDHFLITVDSVEREDLDSGEISDNPIFSSEITCYPEENPWNVNPFIDCTPGGWANVEMGNIRFSK